MNHSILNEFWLAICSNDLSHVNLRLKKEPELSNQDFRLPQNRDPHTDGFPLVRACQEGYYNMAKLLLVFGADVNAPSPELDQREFGMPIQLAVENGHFKLANLLLDHGASVDAHPCCDQQ